MGLKGSSGSLSAQVSITLQIPVVIGEVFSPCQLFQNITAFPCLTACLIFSPHYFMGSFYFTEGQVGIFLLCASVSLQCSGAFPGGVYTLSAWTLQRQSSPLLLPILKIHSLYPCDFSRQLFMFSLPFSKCRSLALYILVSDEIVVMDNTNSISCLAWQCRIQCPSLLCGASCRHPKTSDINIYIFQATFFSLVSCKSCFELCDVSISNTKFHPISVALAYDCYCSPSACLCI